MSHRAGSFPAQRQLHPVGGFLHCRQSSVSLNQRTVVHLKGENEPPSSAAAVNVCVAVDHAQDFIRTSQVLSTGEKGFTVERLQVCRTQQILPVPVCVRYENNFRQT